MLDSKLCLMLPQDGHTSKSATIEWVTKGLYRVQTGDIPQNPPHTSLTGRSCLHVFLVFIFFPDMQVGPSITTSATWPCPSFESGQASKPTTHLGMSFVEGPFSGCFIGTPKGNHPLCGFPHFKTNPFWRATRTSEPRPALAISLFRPPGQQL